jgi:hypothetical protein
MALLSQPQILLRIPQTYQRGERTHKPCFCEVPLQSFQGERYMPYLRQGLFSQDTFRLDTGFNESE